MKDDEYKGYYCLLIAILCDLNAAEASTMYEYGPDHPLCRKILKKKVRKPSIRKLKETEQAAAMNRCNKKKRQKTNRIPVRR